MLVLQAQGGGEALALQLGEAVHEIIEGPRIASCRLQQGQHQRQQGFDRHNLLCRQQRARLLPAVNHAGPQGHKAIARGKPVHRLHFTSVDQDGAEVAIGIGQVQTVAKADEGAVTLR